MTTEEDKKQEQEEEGEVVLTLDNREGKLIEEIQTLQRRTPSFQKIVVRTENLELGDITIKVNHHNILMERKSVDDLLASIKDGRYEEQSLRLKTLKEQSVYYVIEGRPRSNQQTVYSSILSLNYFKGFSVLKTQDVKETAEMILCFCVKLNKEKKKVVGEVAEPSYTTVISKKKSDNITVKNFGEIVLCQIPTVNHTFAKVIMERYEHDLLRLIDALKEDKKCLDDLTYVSSGGKKRRIGKNCIEKIVTFLGSH